MNLTGDKGVPICIKQIFTCTFQSYIMSILYGEKVTIGS